MFMLDVIFAMRRNVGRREWDDMRWEERGEEQPRHASISSRKTYSMTCSVHQVICQQIMHTIAIQKELEVELG